MFEKYNLSEKSIAILYDIYNKPWVSADALTVKYIDPILVGSILDELIKHELIIEAEMAFISSEMADELIEYVEPIQYDLTFKEKAIDLVKALTELGATFKVVNDYKTFSAAHLKPRWNGLREFNIKDKNTIRLYMEIKSCPEELMSALLKIENVLTKPSKCGKILYIDYTSTDENLSETVSTFKQFA